MSNAPQATPAHFNFGPYIDAVSRLNSFLHIGWAGLGYGTVAHEVREVLRRQDSEFERDEIQRLQAFAKQQTDAGFPYLYGIAVIRLWTILETLVEDLILHALQVLPDSKSAETLKKLRGPLLDFAQASPAEQAEFLLELLKQEVRAPLKPGIGRFESLLEVVGLSGPMDDNARRAILELSQVRNVLVHRDGIADARLVERCPWLKLRAGDIVAVSGKRYSIYQTAVHWYILELSERWMSKHTPSQQWREDALWVRTGEVKGRLEWLLAQFSKTN